VANLPAHQRKARHSEAFFDLHSKIANCVRSYPDWCITVIYYAALQYIDAKLARMNMHPEDHYNRDPMVANNLRAVSAPYFFLQDRSETARYFPDSERKFSETDVRECIDKLMVIEPNTVLKIFSSRLKTPFK
jgi:hypothetical protein